MTRKRTALRDSLSVLPANDWLPYADGLAAAMRAAANGTPNRDCGGDFTDTELDQMDE